MKTARFIAAAREEFFAELAYYNQARNGLGLRFSRAVELATMRALAYPSAGTPVPGGARRVVIKDFPFSLIYRPEKNGIVILAVSHHSRRPGYWRNRSSKG